MTFCVSPEGFFNVATSPVVGVIVSAVNCIAVPAANPMAELINALAARDRIPLDIIGIENVSFGFSEYRAILSRFFRMSSGLGFPFDDDSCADTADSPDRGGAIFFIVMF